MERLPDVMCTPRLTLRRWVDADAPALSAAVSASLEHLRPWMPWVAKEPIWPAERLAVIDQWRMDWEQGGDLVVGMFMDGVVVGGSGLHRRRGPGVLEIGYWVHVDQIGKGIASEVAEALTTAAFTVPGIERVEIHHDKANVASAAVPRRLGFTLADETRDVASSPGEAGIDCRWLITRQEWQSKAAPLRATSWVRRPGAVVSTSHGFVDQEASQENAQEEAQEDAAPHTSPTPTRQVTH